MIKINGSLINISRPLFFLAILLICKSLIGQTPVPQEVSEQDKNSLFYDSLKVKATKNKLTHKLYDLMIVQSDPVASKSITTSSLDNFTGYKGKIIRSIEIRRLNVFGTDLSNPMFQDSSKIDKLLNKTHINTNERIIRKYLLFSIGDSISPLVLSDNERVLRQLSFIDDARVVIVPFSENEADVIIVIRDVYSLGVDYSFRSLNKGTFKLFERNIFGIGHELEFSVPYDGRFKDSPGFGANYRINNIGRTFSNLGVNYFSGLGRTTYGINITRDFLTSATKYAGGITIRETSTTEDLDTLPSPAPLEYVYQDYWLARSFLIDESSVKRFIIGARYTNNNVFERPEITSNSYHSLQKYKMILGSMALSLQKFYKTSLIYNYGRTEDIPYGALFRVTAGREFNEFKVRTYLAGDISAGKSFKSIGYFYFNAGYSTFLNDLSFEQGLFTLKMNHFSNLYNIGKFRVRNFANINYTRGFSRYTDEYLYVENKYGMSGFTNDSLRGTTRLMVNLESVIFSPINVYGFRFAFFGFADLAILSHRETLQIRNEFLSGLGVGIRIRNDNLILSTFQIRLGYFPNPPSYSNMNYLRISGEQLFRPATFDTGPPAVIVYR